MKVPDAYTVLFTTHVTKAECHLGYLHTAEETISYTHRVLFKDCLMFSVYILAFLLAEFNHFSASSCTVSGHAFQLEGT